MPNDEDITVRIDWEKQGAGTEELRVFWMAGAASGQIAFEPGRERQRRRGGNGEEIEPTEVEARRAGRREALTKGNLKALLDLARPVRLPAPTFRGRPTGERPRLFRMAITEAKAKTIQGEEIAEETVYSLEMLFGDPGAPVRQVITGSHVQAHLAALVQEAHELVEAELAEAE
jgi:hypothetical protein